MADNILGGRPMSGIHYAGKDYIEEPEVRRIVQAALATNEQRNTRISELEAALRSLRSWDMVQEPASGCGEPCADAPWARKIIDAVLGKNSAP